MTIAAESASTMGSLSNGTIWIIIGLLWVLVPIAVVIIERRRGTPWFQTILLFIVVLVAPIFGLLIWALYRIGEARRKTRLNHSAIGGNT